ncbi:magnesium and cobalt transport protein CorA [Dokdonia pacifica]|uniref:Magnesium transport protein CorA n=1 Tax=Dokdonia pacifica TaxID=1627892 RepID=A0A239DDM2_9FLAO|nr:magnesium/cobalt transporter CorA [Dokdonia pacifica]GGG39837.1 magnesium and cobalt transport protein CorA [Dokdonia pacifica]SNS30420.1 magnesium transporter [Dokdonia pacifica]
MAKNKRIKTGMAPGSIIYTGDKAITDTMIHHLQFTSDSIKDSVVKNEKEIKINKNSDSDLIDWIDLRGMQNIEVISSISSLFKIHPLLQESIVDVYQRPSFEEYENGIFIIVKALSFDKNTISVSKEHVAIFLKHNVLLTFQETPSDLFESVRKRMSNTMSRVRQRGADYLLFALLDTLIDNYHITLDRFEETIEEIEDRITEEQRSSDKAVIHKLKKELVVLRKSIAPLREVISKFSKSESEVIKNTTQIFIRNLYENTVQITDSIDSYRDMLTSLQDLFIAEVSFKMNKVMQLLTLISVIFIPLTFLAGIYGMNFEYIPELQYRYGYFVLLGVMLAIFIMLLILFRKKKWL